MRAFSHRDRPKPASRMPGCDVVVSGVTSIDHRSSWYDGMEPGKHLGGSTLLWCPSSLASWPRSAAPAIYQKVGYRPACDYVDMQIDREDADQTAWATEKRLRYLGVRRDKTPPTKTQKPIDPLTIMPFVITIRSHLPSSVLVAGVPQQRPP